MTEWRWGWTINIELNTLLGTLSACTGTTLTFQAAASHSAANGDTIQFLQWRAAAKIANDAGATNWPVAVAVFAASLTPCNGSMVGFGVIVDGEAIGSKGYGTAVAGGGGLTLPRLLRRHKLDIPLMETT